MLNIEPSAVGGGWMLKAEGSKQNCWTWYQSERSQRTKL